MEQIKVRDITVGDFMVYPDGRRDEIIALRDIPTSRHVNIVMISGNQIDRFPDDMLDIVRATAVAKE